MAFLNIRNLCAFYGMARSLDDVSLTMQEGDIVGIVGANGAGKSTLMDSIMGLVKTTGSIKLGEDEMTGRPSADIVKLGVGYAPERAHLFPYLSVEDNLLIGSHTVRDRARENMQLVHDLFPVLKTRRLQETVTQSGGERQMASLGRALMTNPRLLLVDEPTIGLAPKVCLDIAEALKRLNGETGLTILIAEQNVNFATSLASSLHVLETGNIVMSGETAEIVADPDLNKAYFGH